MSIRNRMNDSVAFRTTIVVVTLVGLILLFFGLWQVHHVRKVMVEEVHRQASRSMDGAIKAIDDRVSDVETAVQTAAAYADLFAYDDKNCYHLLERLIRHNADIAAVTLLYRENYFPAHGRYYAPTVYNDAETKAVEHDEIGGPEHDFCYLETDSNWIYTNVKEAGYWCLPYLDSMSTKRPMVTYSVPLKEPNGSIYAVLCADVDLEWVKTVIDDVKPYPYSRVSVVSRDEQFICHPDSSCILSVNALKLVSEKGNKKSMELIQRMLRWEKGSDTMTAPLHVLTDEEEDDRDELTANQIVYFAPVDRVFWSVSFSIPEDEILKTPNQLQRSMFYLLGLMAVSLSLLIFFVIHFHLRPLKLLADSTREIAKGNFDVPMPVITTHDEIRHLRDSFEEMQSSLSRYVSELKRTTSMKASMESELKVANDIQMSMIPKTFPPYPERDDIEISGQLTPAKAVGGDFYDFYIRDEKLFFCIGDVSGKGVPAALVMAVTRSLFKTLSAREAAPERVMMQMNESLADQSESNMFVTMLIGVLDLPTGRMRICNAGHNVPLLINGAVETMTIDSNIPLGVMSDWKYTSQEMLISPQTIIFLYTDGLTEAENSDHGQFGEERMMDVAEQLLAEEDKSPNILLERMSDAVSIFVDHAEQSDDLTMLAIQYTKEHRDAKLQREITLPNDVQTVPQLAQFVDEVCEALGFDMSLTMQMNLALEEAVVNVMSYAYPKGSVGDVNIVAEANDVRLKFTITDSGLPFDPTTKEEIDTTLSLEERPIGGLGIFLVRELMDSINYERIKGKNVLTRRKTLSTIQQSTTLSH